MSLALIIVIAYMGLLALLSWLSAYLQRGSGSAGFLLANRQLTWPLVGVMIAGIAIGGSATVGVAQNAYTAGLSAGWYNLAWATGPLFIGCFLAKKIRRANTRSMSRIFGIVFGERFETVCALIQIAILTAITAVQIVAGGAILTALLPESFTMQMGIVVSTVVFGMIAVTGGLLAASLSNVLNLIVIYLGIVLGLVASLRGAGGFAAVRASLPAGLSGDGSHWFDLTSGIGSIAILSWVLTMFLQAIANNGVCLSFIAARSPRDAAKGAFLGAALMIPAGFLTALLGITAAAELPGLDNAALALPRIVATFSPWIGGILLAGLWAADVSTATGMLVAVSASINQDFLDKYWPHRHPASRRGELRRTRAITLAVVLVAGLAAGQMNDILASLLTALALFAPYSLLMILVFMAPRFLRQSTGWLTIGSSLLAFFLAQFVLPSLRILDQTMFTCAAVALAAIALSQLDPRRLSVAALYEAERAEAEEETPCQKALC